MLLCRVIFFNKIRYLDHTNFSLAYCIWNTFFGICAICLTGIYVHINDAAVRQMCSSNFFLGIPEYICINHRYAADITAVPSRKMNNKFSWVLM